MTVFDIAVLAILLISALIAISRGFVEELATVINWSVAVAITAVISPLFYQQIYDFIQINWLTYTFSAFIVFVPCMLFSSVIFNLILKKIITIIFKPVNLSISIIFGLLRGSIVIVVIYAGIEMSLPSNKPRPEWIKGYTLPFVEDTTKIFIKTFFMGIIKKYKNIKI